MDRSIMFAMPVLLLASAHHVSAGYNAWTRGEGQGFIEYHYSDPDAGNSISIGCDEAATEDHSGTGIVLEVNGLLPPNSEVRFIIDGRAITIPSDRTGGISGSGCPECARKFAQLWPMLRKGDTLVIVASDRRRASFPLRGLVKLMPARPCAAGIGTDG